ncbi:hypothetical protein [Duganella sp. CF517]|uniref:hypothetical protein n=1 Tax=Duganella sp. CF517 TaxID=1881038 RepID=UPI001160C1FB|nr:hypothetical protein [Duganella sp. CF517]
MILSGSRPNYTTAALRRAVAAAATAIGADSARRRGQPLFSPTYEGLRRFLKAPHGTDQAVRYIDEAIDMARASKKLP